MTVERLVDRERSRLRWLLVAAGAAGGVAAALLVLLGASAILGHARWMALPPITPFVAWGAAIAALTLAAAWTWRRARRDSSRSGVAAAIERELALRAGSLRGALEVSRSGVLGRRGAESLAGKLSSRGPVLARESHRRAVWRAGAAGALALVVMLLSAAYAPAVSDGWAALAHPVRAWNGTLLEPITVQAPPEVLRGERIRVVVRAPSRAHVRLAQRATGGAWSTRSLPAEASAPGLFVADVGPVDADLVLVARDGRSSSDTTLVRVTDRPFVGDVAVHAIYPGYLRRAAEALPLSEPARIPRGTLLRVTGRASTALGGVQLVRESDTVQLTASGHGFSGQLSPSRSGRWSWRASAVHGRPIQDVPDPLELEVLPDSAPRVVILAPARDTVVAPLDRIRLSILASDDHALAGVVLRSWRESATGRAGPSMSQRLASPGAGPDAEQWTGEAILDLAARGLVPGDALHLVAVATDASPWNQTGESRELVIRIPSLSERRAMAREAADSAVARASAAAGAQRRLADRTGDAARSRGSRPAGGERAGSASRGRDATPMSYEAAERARTLLQEQRELAERVREVREAANALERQLDEAGALDSGLVRRLQEAQALLAEALTPELAEQLRELEQALRKLSAEDARAALGSLAEQQRRLREQLERSVEMLRRAALEGAMQTLRDEARELARREQAFADSLAAAGRDSTPALEARDLAERSRELRQQVAELSKRLEREQAEPAVRRTSAAEQHAGASAAAMDRAARAAQEMEPRSGERRRRSAESAPAGQEDARSGESPAEQARDAAREMERAADALADARESQVEAWKKELTQELDRSIQEILQLAREEQQLEQQTRMGGSPGELQSQQSAVQQGVEQAAERVREAGKKSSLVSGRSQRAMADAQRAVEQATQQGSRSRGSGRQAASAMGDASEALNRAAAALVRDRERASRATSASGFAEMMAQLQELSRRQGGLNAQAQGLLQSPAAHAAEQARAAGRSLARQQRGVAQSLEQMGELDGSGKLSELARDARQIAEALEGGRIDAATLGRQQQLLRRLLDAGTTYDDEDQDESGKREARAATGDERFTPGSGATRGPDASRFREPAWSELRGLSPEERRAVLEYFKRINAGSP